MADHYNDEGYPLCSSCGAVEADYPDDQLSGWIEHPGGFTCMECQTDTEHLDAMAQGQEDAEDLNTPHARRLIEDERKRRLTIFDRRRGQQTEGREANG